MDTIYLTLAYNDGFWIARNGKLTARGRTIDDLDKDIRANLQKYFRSGNKVKIRMEFDYTTIPFWMRQYSPYYLHRIVCIEF